MTIIPDTSGFQGDGDARWVDPAAGDVMSTHFFDLVPNLPAGLDDLPRLRHELAMQSAEVGGLVEAFVVTIDGSPAVLQVVKVPMPDQRGLAYIASITVPKAESSAVLKLTAIEGSTTGIRESAVLADVMNETGGPDAFYAPHPYAPQSQPKLPWNRADDPRLDERFPDHPLSRARRWLRHVVATARLDPEFARQPPFGTPVSVAMGLPIGPFLPLWTVKETVTYWRMQDPDAVRARLGRGGTRRRSLNDAEASEAAWLDPATGRLALSDEPFLRIEPVSDETAYTSVTTEEIVAAFDWIGELSVAAGERAEMLLVRPASTDDGADNYVLMRLQVHNGDRANPSCVVETSPIPVGAEFWDKLPPLSKPNTTGFARVRDADHALHDGRLTMWAVQTWDVHPFRLMLSFQPNPGLR